MSATHSTRKASATCAARTSCSRARSGSRRSAFSSELEQLRPIGGAAKLAVDQDQIGGVRCGWPDAEVVRDAVTVDAQRANPGASRRARRRCRPRGVFLLVLCVV